MPIVDADQLGQAWRSPMTRVEERTHETRALFIADPWFVVAFLLPIGAVLLSLMQTEDLAYQIRAGQLMWSSHSILRTDSFTFTVAGRTWIDQQYGAQIVLAKLFAVGGWRTLVIARAVVVGFAVGTTYIRTKRIGCGSIIAAGLTFGCLLVCMTLPGTLAMRPQLLAVPLFLLAVGLLSSRTQRPRRLLWIPLIAIVWANLHGSFILLPILCAIGFAADLIARRLVWRTGGLVLITLLTPLATPWGIHTYGYAFTLVRAPIVREVIDEWRPVFRLWPAGTLFLGAVALGVVFLARGGWRQLTPEDALTLLVFTALPLVGGRNLIWWALATPPALARAVSMRKVSSWAPAAARVVAGTLVGLIVLGLFSVLRTQPQERLLSDAPLGITTATLDLVPPNSRVFAGWWQSWLEFAAPGDQYFVDARAELFPRSVWDDFFRLSEAASGWQGILDRWGIDAVVASRVHQAPLIPALESDVAWTEVYADEAGAIFVRDNPAT
jgi:hypothetical protein